MKCERIITTTAAAMLLGGCSLLNPYNDEAACNMNDNGSCASVSDAYEVATGNAERKNRINNDGEIKAINEGAEKNGTNEAGQIETYRTAAYREVSLLLKEPVTPVVAPPKVSRLLFLEYTAENAQLFMPRFVYVLNEHPTFVLGDYLHRNEEDALLSVLEVVQ
jgi:conjugal transfer pilus assembly protein TraV